jgi:hypothetical protein
MHSSVPQTIVERVIEKPVEIIREVLVEVPTVEYRDKIVYVDKHVEKPVSAEHAALISQQATQIAALQTQLKAAEEAKVAAEAKATAAKKEAEAKAADKAKAAAATAQQPTWSENKSPELEDDQKRLKFKQPIQQSRAAATAFTSDSMRPSKKNQKQEEQGTNGAQAAPTQAGATASPAAAADADVADKEQEAPEARKLQKQDKETASPPKPVATVASSPAIPTVPSASASGSPERVKLGASAPKPKTADVADAGAMMQATKEAEAQVAADAKAAAEAEALQISASQLHAYVSLSPLSHVRPSLLPFLPISPLGESICLSSLAFLSSPLPCTACRVHFMLETHLCRLLSPASFNIYISGLRSGFFFFKLSVLKCLRSNKRENALISTTCL